MDMDGSSSGLLQQHGVDDDEESTKVHPRAVYQGGEDEPVESATSLLSAWMHLLVFFLTCVILRTLLLLNVFEDGDVVSPALFLTVVCAAANVLIDVKCYNVHRRASTGLDFGKQSPSLGRAGIKCCGLAGSFGMLFVLYWALPEYYSGSFYDSYYEMLWTVLPPLIPLAAFYIYYVDSYMVHPKDGYWHMGMLVVCRWEHVNQAILWQHVLSWLVKGFFTPLMFVPLCNDIQQLLRTNFRDFDSWGQYYNWLFSFLYFIDLHFANIGYLMTFRLFDTHIRATEPTVLGWLVALLCYSPINTLTGYYFGYESDMDWQEWLEPHPIIGFFWGTAILVLTLLYTMSAVSFGIRFSNLTHRGIITTGPYALTKHPAYLFKNISWWMTHIPFAVSSGSITEALRNCLGLLMFNGVYLLRARCEESMLSNDPQYVRYAKYMDKHGIFASISEMIRKGSGGRSSPRDRSLE